MKSPYITAQRLIGALKFAGFKCDIVGGIWKNKPRPHDIDLIVESAGHGAAIDLLSMVALSVIKDIPDKDRVPIEFYLADREYYDKLKEALRAHRYQVIKFKMMSGLKFKKFTY